MSEDKLLKIWFINHYANPPSAPGDARHFSHARELIRRGHKVHIIACSMLHLQQSEVVKQEGRDPWTHATHEGVPFTWIPGQPYEGRSLQRILNMFQFAWRTARLKWAEGLTPPDLVMGSSPHPFAALAAQRVAAHYKVPFILEIRDAWPYVLTEVGGSSRYHPFVWLVDRTMRFLYARANRIIMFSKNSAPLLAQYGAETDKIVWIPHGVDLEICPKPRPAEDDGRFTVTYIGSHNQWNSLDAILDAAKLLQSRASQDIVIRFVGSGSHKSRLMERARAERITNVQFLDSVPKTQIKSLLNSSDAFIINNRKDGASKQWMSFSKLYEYLAAGRPVVFGSFTENDPVRESGAGVSVESDNPEALANGIAFLAGCTPEQLAEFGRLGRRHIESYYSIPVLVDQFESKVLEAACPALSVTVHGH